VHGAQVGKEESLSRTVREIIEKLAYLKKYLKTSYNSYINELSSSFDWHNVRRVSQMNRLHLTAPLPFFLFSFLGSTRGTFNGNFLL